MESADFCMGFMVTQNHTEYIAFVYGIVIGFESLMKYIPSQPAIY